MKSENLTSKLFSLSCENQPGVLTRIVTMFTKPGYVVKTISQSATDVSDIVLITMEVVIPGNAVDNIINKLHRIIGVFDITVSFGSALSSAIFRLSPGNFDGSLWDILNRHNARALSMQADGHLLVLQVAQQPEIQRLYNELDGPALLGFSVLPLAISQPLVWDDAKNSEPAQLEDHQQQEELVTA